MIVQSSKVSHGVWVPDPRWSWYYTPIWRDLVTVVTITTLNHDFATGGFTSGSLTKADFQPPELMKNYVYLTDEEYVMWKLAGYETEGQYNLTQLRKDGIIYN